MEPATPFFCLRAGEKEVFACATSKYVRQHLPRLVPTWSDASAWAILLLQQATVSLSETTATVEAEKQRLRGEFIAFSFALAFALRGRGYTAEVFDPRSAGPLLSPPGDLRHNDVRAAACLPAMEVLPGICPMLVHPAWGTAVYPATILASARPDICLPLVRATARARGWRDVRVDGVSP